jgi:hypothetical protein
MYENYRFNILKIPVINRNNSSRLTAAVRWQTISICCLLQMVMIRTQLPSVDNALVQY